MAAGGLVIVAPCVRIGPGDGSPLTGEAEARLVRTVVDTHLHLPGMFALTFADSTGLALADAGITIGVRVQVWGAAAGDLSARRLITGEVTALEGRYENLAGRTVVRGYDLSHRLQRVRRTRTFVNMTDSDVAAKVARQGGLPLGEITPARVVHDHLGQCDQTDWDFLKQRAREIGYEFGMTPDGKFRFRKSSSVDGGARPLALALGDNLRTFAPRLTAGNLAAGVEVRVWDPLRARVTSATAGMATGTARTGGPDAAGLGRQFGHPPGGAGPGAAGPGMAGTGMAETGVAGTGVAGTGVAGTGVAGPGDSLGPPPSPAAHVVAGLPAGSGAAASAAADQAAGGLSEHLASTYAEAEGSAAGDPRIAAGAVIGVTGIPAPFTGNWVVTTARHIFDRAEGGYRTMFTVSGRHERSLLGLACLGATQSPLPRIPGVVCGIVSNVNDARSRVKVTLPWLSPDYESDWAPVVQFGAGSRSGAMFLPEPGDEVLVGFEFGDTRRPYVLGGIVNDHSRYDLGGPAVQASGPAGEVVRRGFVSATGNRLAFHDQLPPGADGGRPVTSEIVLGTGDGTVRLAIDAVAGRLVLACTPGEPPGHLAIECGNAGTVDIRTGPGGAVNIDGGASLSLKAETAVKIQSGGEVTIQGAQIKLN